MTDRTRSFGKHGLTAALASLATAAGLWLAGHAAPSAQAAQPSEVAGLRAIVEFRFDALDRRLERLERAQDARAIPAGGR